MFIVLFASDNMQQRYSSCYVFLLFMFISDQSRSSSTIVANMSGGKQSDNGRLLL